MARSSRKRQRRSGVISVTVKTNERIVAVRATRMRRKRSPRRDLIVGFIDDLRKQVKLVLRSLYQLLKAKRGIFPHKKRERLMY